MTPILLMIYSKDQADTSEHTLDNSNLNLVDMYESINKATHTNWIAAICLAIVMILFVYIFVLVLIWYIERRKMVPDLIGKNFSLFNIMTLGKGNAEAITPGMMFAIVLTATLILLTIVGGFYFDIVIKFLSYIVYFIRGLLNV